MGSIYIKSPTLLSGNTGTNASEFLGLVKDLFYPGSS